MKRSPSALATGLNLAGLLGLLVFSSLALWLVTSELSDFKAGRTPSTRASHRRGHRPPLSARNTTGPDLAPASSRPGAAQDLLKGV